MASKDLCDNLSLDVQININQKIKMTVSQKPTEEDFRPKFFKGVHRLCRNCRREKKTIAQVVLDEISRGAWLDDELRRGHKLLINRNGEITELHVPHLDKLNPNGRPSLDEDPTPKNLERTL